MHTHTHKHTHTHTQAPVRDLVDMGVNVGVCLPVWRSLDATLVLPRACTLHPQYVPVSPSVPPYSLSYSLAVSLSLSLSLSRARARSPSLLFACACVRVCVCLSAYGEGPESPSQGLAELV